jgi:ABC-type uncharacterized transport system permease subunit
VTALANVFYGATVLLTIASVALSLLAPVWRPSLRFGRYAVIAAAVSASVGLSVRWFVAGHPAMFGTFENTYALAATLLVAAVGAGFWRPKWQELWRWSAPWALLALLYGARFRHEPVPLTISEQSLWVDVHAAFAWVAFVTLLAAGTYSALRLLGRRPLSLEPEDGDVFVTECLMAGFCALTAAIASGSWYSFLLFGQFWKWSIVETLSLVAWLGYAIVIHGRLFYHWRDRRLDIGVVAIVPVLIAAYFVWSVLPNTWHYFDIPLAKPY